MARISSVRSANCTLLCVLSRVARLAFLRPNSRNLAFFIVVWHEKSGVWYVRHSLSFFGLFYGIDMKTRCLALFKTSDSVTAVGLESYNFFSG